MVAWILPFWEWTEVFYGKDVSGKLAKTLRKTPTIESYLSNVGGLDIHLYYKKVSIALVFLESLQNCSDQVQMLSAADIW